MKKISYANTKLKKKVMATLTSGEVKLLKWIIKNKEDHFNGKIVDELR